MSAGTPGSNAGVPRLTDAKHVTAIQTYTQARGSQHELGFAPIGAEGKPRTCQICNTGRGMRMPGVRHQTPSTMQCMTCQVSVCGPGCWKLLHGYYKAGEEPKESPKTFKGGKTVADAENFDEVEEVEGFEVEDE